MTKLREEIARSRHTADTDPIQYDHSEHVKVEMYANDMGSWSVKVSCPTNPALDYPLKKFQDEPSAEHYARQCCDAINRKMINESLIRRIIRNILQETI